MGLEAAAIAAIVSASAAGVSAISQMRQGDKQPAITPPQQPEKPPTLDLFKRRARTAGAYGTPDSGSLSAPSTGTTLLGQ